MIDYANKKFNYLTILQDVPSHLKRNGRCVKAKCVCGKIKTYILARILNESTKSCGCFKGNKGKHLFKHGLSRHPLSSIWSAIIQRCTNPNCKVFNHYGGRGVCICNEWKNDFMAFYNWCISNGWKIGLEVDKDIKGNGLLYSPDTCVIATEKENRNRTRSNHYEYVDGVKYSLSEIADKYNLSYGTLKGRIKRGWNIKKAIETPINVISRVY